MKVDNKGNSQDIPEYKIKEKIQVYDTVLKSLVKFSNNSSNGNVGGVLFGHETDDAIVISQAIPLAKNHKFDDISNIISYLHESRLDYVKVGFFSCNENTNLIKKIGLKNLIDFQKVFPSAVVLNYYNNFFKSGNYSFDCFRLDKVFIEKIELIQIEEDDPNIFKKFTKQNEILKKLNFELVNDVHTVLCNLVSSTESDDINQIISENKNQKKKLFISLHELNKNSEKFLDEQKKYIEYFKLKKSFGKNKENEFKESLNKKGNELSKMEKIDISIISKNLASISEQITTMIDRSNIKNAFFTDVCAATSN